MYSFLELETEKVLIVPVERRRGLSKITHSNRGYNAFRNSESHRERHGSVSKML